MSGQDCFLPGSCCAHHPKAGRCICIDGIIELPPNLYDPAEMPCPRCQPDAYPDGFPGVRAQPDTVFDHWLIPPEPAPAAPST